jgi:hypothetical protein
MKRNPLEEYAGKRDFKQTREPGPRVKKLKQKLKSSEVE